MTEPPVGDAATSNLRIAVQALSDRDGLSSVSAGQAIGGTFGALLSAILISLLTLPLLPGALIAGTLIMGGRSVGGWITARSLRTRYTSSWDQVELLRLTLVQLGMPADAVPLAIHALAQAEVDGSVLADPFAVLRLLPPNLFPVPAAPATLSSRAVAAGESTARLSPPHSPESGRGS